MWNITNPREIVQIKAALKFWMEMAKLSDRHPSRHPTVASDFTNYLPMTIREIEDLTKTGPAGAILKPMLMSSVEAADLYRLNRRTLQREIVKLGIKPVCRIGRMFLYERDELVVAAGHVIGRRKRGPTER